MKKINLIGKYGSGKTAIVDDEDYDWLNQWRWRCSKSGYVMRQFHNKPTIWMHKLLCPSTDKVDHINHNTFNNQKHNLRPATQQQNVFNQRKCFRTTSSRYKGVHWFKRDNCWHSQIALKRKKYHIGYFSNERWAAMARDIWAKELHGEFAYLNFTNLFP